MGGSTVRQNCKWIPSVRPETEYGGGEFFNSDHPDLISSLRSINNYSQWVDSRLIPIVSKWIDENRERMIDGMSDEEMNDMGSAVEKAYQILVDDGYVDERKRDIDPNEIPPELINPIWQRENKKRNE